MKLEETIKSEDTIKSEVKEVFEVDEGFVPENFVSVSMIPEVESYAGTLDYDYEPPGMFKVLYFNWEGGG